MYLTVEEFRARTPQREVPKQRRDGTEDTALIEASIADAEATCRIYLDVLVAADGSAVPAGDLPADLIVRLKGIVYRLARAELYDGRSGSAEDIEMRRRAAMKDLMAMREDPQAPDEAEAELVQGASRWAPPTARAEVD